MRWNLLVAGAAASWGLVSVIVAGVGIAGYALVFWRCLFAAAAIPFLAWALGRLDRLALRRHRARTVVLGLLLALHWALFFETVKRSSVAVAILTVYTAPIFLAVLAPLFLPERRSRVGIVALTISAPGLVLIALGGEAGGKGVDPVAIATGIGAALLYAVIVIAQKDTLRSVSPFALAFWQYVTAAVALAPALLAADRALPRGAEWGYLVLMGSVLTATVGVVYLLCLRNVTAQAAGLLGYVEPVSASVLAWAILGQTIGWQVALGGAAVLAGGALVVLYAEGEPAALEAPELAGAVRIGE